MFRVSMIVSALLIVGITAKPWNKNEAVEEKVVSVDEKERLSWEVEPPEDMHDIHYDIDPRMRVWKSMKVPKVEEDWDELNHPSTNELRLQIQNTDSAEDDQTENYVVEYRQDAKDRNSIDHAVFSEVIAEEPQDSDEDNEEREKVLRYLAPLMAGHKVDVGGALDQPDVNEDQVSSVEMEAVRSNREGRIHLQPEEDMDDLYHKEVLVPVFYQDDSKAAAPVHMPAQRKYTEPEVDMDDLYHK
ncbi:uncharacterized protein si:ch211-217g15.3 [Nematolebias whitei]|uniref:uncharacterized protein si:ch211-217g15.3 n=1 Tax=Nematolebias whitei TaxID=451745 RepID=UPI001897C237|nr:uncharacterized protein si:ch211-217g15.3 [Nematolebias whitei]